MKKLSLLIIIIFSILSIKAQDSKFQAMSIYNFTRTLQWAPDYQKGNFIICVYGNSDLYKELANYTAGKKVRGEQKIIVKKTNLSDIDKCHIIIVAKDKTASLTNVTKKFKGKSTLIITEQKALTPKGAGVSFIKDKNGTVSYQYNASNISQNKISVSTSFKQIGIAN